MCKKQAIYFYIELSVLLIIPFKYVGDCRLSHNKWNRENKMEINQCNEQIDVVIKLEPKDEIDIVKSIKKCRVNIVRLPADDGEIEVKEQPIHIKKEPIDIKEEPIDLKDESIDIKDEPIYIKEEPIDIKEEIESNDETELLPNEDGTVECPLCQKPIKAPYLKRHLNYHRKNESTSFSCNICNEKFPEKRKLIAHKGKNHDMI